MPDALSPCCGVLLVSAVSFILFVAPMTIVSYERDVWHHMAATNALQQ